MTEREIIREMRRLENEIEAAEATGVPTKQAQVRLDCLYGALKRMDAAEESEKKARGEK